MTRTATPFQVVLTADFYDATGHLKCRDIGLDLFNMASGGRQPPDSSAKASGGCQPPDSSSSASAASVASPSASPRGINVQRFPKHHPVIGPEQLAGANGVIVLTPRVTTIHKGGRNHSVFIRGHL